MAVTRVVGIDFGTSTSVIKVKSYQDGNAPREDTIYTDSIQFDSRETVPTLVFETKRGEFICGDRAGKVPERGVLHANFKMDLISLDPEKRQHAEFLVEKFFEYLYGVYRNYEDALGPCTKEETFISYPAKWPDTVRERMLDIARRAGFRNVDGRDEPTAAIHTVMLHQIEKIQQLNLLEAGKPAYILCIDLGAGTTDLALCRYSLGEHTQVEKLLTWPTVESPDLFGGREIDQTLVKYIQAYLRQCGVKNVESFFSSKALDSVKTWKESSLSPSLAEGLSAGTPAFLDTMCAMLPINFDDFPPIDRDVFEAMMGDQLVTFARMVRECIAEAAKQGKGFSGAEDIDLVILTGGHSNWYFLPELLMGKIFPGLKEPLSLPKLRKQPERLIRLARPHETVAYGLVYQRLSVPVKNCAANSVWVHFDIDGHTTQPVLAVPYGHVLPYRQEFTQKITLMQGDKTSNITFTCVKHSGQTFEEAFIDQIQKTLLRTAFSALWDIIVVLFGGAQPRTREFTMRFTAEMDENQIIKITGTIQGSGYQRVDFTF